MEEPQDPTERDREDEDLEMDAEQAEDVKGGLLSKYSDGGLKPPPTSTTTTTTTTTSPTSPILRPPPA